MNYIQQLNAFEEWIELNCLPATEELLWRRLFRLNNMFGWAEWFFIDNIKLAGRVGVSERALIDIRHRLQQRGLIDFIPGKKGKPTKYKLIQLYKNAEDTSVQTSVKSSVNTSVQTSANINSKRKQKNNTPISPEIISSYTENNDLVAALDSFTEMREVKKKPLTDNSLKLLLGKLDKLAKNDEEKIQILNESIMNNWQGVFPLKDVQRSNVVNLPPKKVNRL